MFFLTKAFAEKVGNLVSKLEEVADKLVTSASISRPSQQLADLLCHLWSNVVLIWYYFLKWSNLISIWYYHLQYGAMWVHNFLLLPIVHLVESHICKVESVHPVDDFARVVRLGRLLQDPHHLQSSSSLVEKKKPPLRFHRSSAWRGSFDSQLPRRCLSPPTITSFGFPEKNKFRKIDRHLVQDLNEYLHAADENGGEGLDLLKMLSKTLPLARVQKILLTTFHVVRHLVQ